MLQSLLGKLGYGLGLTLWVVVSMMIGQTLAGFMVATMPSSVNDSVLMTLGAALGYTFGLALALGIPAIVWRKSAASKKTLGVDRLPSWSDIGLSILSVLPYYVISAIVLYLGMEVLKVIDPNVGQQVGFDNLSIKIEFFVAFVTLVIMAPLAEELLFRGYFLGRLQEKTGKWLAVLVTAVVFGLLHVPGITDNGFVLQWGAAADTFALGLVAGSLRVVTGNIWAGAILHAIKNGIAFYFLFINPLPPG